MIRSNHPIPDGYRFFFGPVLAFFGTMVLVQAQRTTPYTPLTNPISRLLLDNLALGSIAIYALILLRREREVVLHSLFFLALLAIIYGLAGPRSDRFAIMVIAVLYALLAVGLRRS